MQFYHTIKIKLFALRVHSLTMHPSPSTNCVKTWELAPIRSISPRDPLRSNQPNAYQQPTVFKKGMSSLCTRVRRLQPKSLKIRAHYSGMHSTVLERPPSNNRIMPFPFPRQRKPSSSMSPGGTSAGPDSDSIRLPWTTNADLRSRRAHLPTYSAFAVGAENHIIIVIDFVEGEKNSEQCRSGRGDNEVWGPAVTSVAFPWAREKCAPLLCHLSRSTVVEVTEASRKPKMYQHSAADVDALGSGDDDESWTRQLVQCDDAPNCFEQMH